jgi:hypothetical protein
VKSAKRQVAKKITNSFLGNELDNTELLSKKRLLNYSPIVEFFINSSEESLVAVIKTGEEKFNPVYRITDLKLIAILESYAETTGGMVYFYKVPLN